MATLKEHVKELCKKNGVSMRKVEQDLGFAQGYLSKIDSITPSSENVQMLAEYFGVPVTELSELVPRKRKKITAVFHKTNAADFFANPTADEERMKKIFETALDEAMTGRYHLSDDEKKIILAYRIAPESTKDIIRKILDVGAAEGSESLTEAG